MFFTRSVPSRVHQAVFKRSRVKMSNDPFSPQSRETIMSAPSAFRFFCCLVSLRRAVFPDLPTPVLAVVSAIWSGCCLALFVLSAL